MCVCVYVFNISFLYLGGYLTEGTHILPETNYVCIFCVHCLCVCACACV